MKTSTKYLITTWIIIALLLITTTTSQFIIAGSAIIAFGITIIHVVDEVEEGKNKNDLKVES